MKRMPQIIIFEEAGESYPSEELIKPGVRIEISSDSKEADPEKVRNQLKVIFEKVLEYFD